MSLVDPTHPDPATLLRVGDVARQSGKTVRAIHLYEEIGLLRPVTRSRGGFRLYDDAALDRVRWIELLSGLGFSLSEMRLVLERWWDAGRAPEAMAQLRSLFERKLEETRVAMARQRELERELVAGLEYLQVCDGCEQTAPPCACAECAEDHGMTSAPALLAGLHRELTPRNPERSTLVRIANGDTPR